MDETENGSGGANAEDGLQAPSSGELENPTRDAATADASSGGKKTKRPLWIVCAAVAVVLAAVVGAGLCFSKKASKPGWLTSYVAAKDLARESGRDVLFCFTGSDWQQSSRDFIDVMYRKDFVKRAGGGFILCHLDIVQDSSLMDPEELETNFKLASRYALTDFPFIVLLTDEGDVYGAGVAPQGDGGFSVDDVLDFVFSFGENRRTLVSLKDAIREAEGAEKARCIDAFLSAVYPSQFEEYQAMIRAVPELDADNETGLRGRYLLQSVWFDARGLYQMGALEDAVACFTTVVHDPSMTPALRQEALYMAASFYASDRSASADKIIALLEDAVAMDPDNQNVEQLKDIIESVKTQAENAGE